MPTITQYGDTNGTPYTASSNLVPQGRNMPFPAAANTANLSGASVPTTGQLWPRTTQK